MIMGNLAKIIVDLDEEKKITPQNWAEALMSDCRSRHVSKCITSEDGCIRLNVSSQKAGKGAVAEATIQPSTPASPEFERLFLEFRGYTGDFLLPSGTLLGFRSSMPRYRSGYRSIDNCDDE